MLTKWFIKSFHKSTNRFWKILLTVPHLLTCYSIHGNRINWLLGSAVHSVCLRLYTLTCCSSFYDVVAHNYCILLIVSLCTTEGFYITVFLSLSECVKLLLSSGTPADVSHENGFTPLHLAAAHGHSRWAHFLLISSPSQEAHTKVNHNRYMPKWVVAPIHVRSLISFLPIGSFPSLKHHQSFHSSLLPKRETSARTPHTQSVRITRIDPGVFAG